MSPYEVFPVELRYATAIVDIHANAARSAYWGIMPDDQPDALGAEGKRQIVEKPVAIRGGGGN